MVEHNIPRPTLFSSVDSKEDVGRVAFGLSSLDLADFDDILRNKLSNKFYWPQDIEEGSQVGPPKFISPNFYDTTSQTSHSLSAVLVPCIKNNSEIRILFTKRSNELRNHSGQISFPGGKKEKDETPDQTAVRETYEEIGVEEDSITTLGQLHYTYTLGNSSLIVPVVGTVTKSNPYRLSSEVTEIFDVNILELMTEDVYSKEIWNFSKDFVREMHFFKIKGHVIWGATSRILYDFLELIAS